MCVEGGKGMGWPSLQRVGRRKCVCGGRGNGKDRLAEGIGLCVEGRERHAGREDERKCLEGGWVGQTRLTRLSCSELGKQYILSYTHFAPQQVPHAN